MAGIMPDPVIQAGIAKAKAAGPTPQVADAASQFGAYAANGSGSAADTTIPLWRANHKQNVRRINSSGEQVVVSVAKPTDPEQYAATDASTQFGVLLMDKAKMAEWGDLAWKAGLITADNRNDANACRANRYFAVVATSGRSRNVGGGFSTMP